MMICEGGLVVDSAAIRDSRGATRGRRTSFFCLRCEQEFAWSKRDKACPVCFGKRFRSSGRSSALGRG